MEIYGDSKAIGKKPKIYSKFSYRSKLLRVEFKVNNFSEQD